MRITRNALNSRIAQRLFLLLLIVVLVPILLTGAVSYDQIHKLIYREQAKYLRTSSKEFGLGVFNRLTNTKEYLSISLSSYLEHGEPTKAQWQSLSHHFSGVWLLKDHQLQTTLLGERSGVEFLLSDQPIQDSRVIVNNPDSSNANIYQSVTVDYLKGWVIVGRVDPEYLWPDSELNAYEQLCVLSAEYGPLHCSSDMDSSLLPSIKNVPRDQLLEWTSSEDEAMVSAYWRLFLGYEFNAEDWFIVISKPEEVVLLELSLFKKVYMPSLLLALLLSIFVSFKLVKRHLAPVESLIKGTNALAKGDLTHRVSIDTGDEYEELASSFNKMTDALKEESSLSLAFSDIDQQIVLKTGLSAFLESILKPLHPLVDATLSAAVLFPPLSQDQNHLYFYDYPTKTLQKTTINLDVLKQSFEGIARDELVHMTHKEVAIRIQHRLVDHANDFSIYIMTHQDEVIAAFVVGFEQRPAQTKLADFFGHVSVALSALYREMALERQANVDLLTNLPNRNAFQKNVTDLIEEAHYKNQFAALLFIDLDRFKNVNDTLGHPAGDQLLREAAERLRDSLPKSAFCARFGGDEFTVFIPNSAHVDLVAICSTIIRKLSENYYLKGYNANISASIGISQFPKDGDSVETLLLAADLAMYKAKDLGRECFEFYSQQLSEAVEERIKIENFLKHVLQNQQLEVYYQPKVDIQQQVLSGFEALSRFKQKDGAFLSPQKLFEVAEETGHVLEIGYYVLDQSIQQVKTWMQMGIWQGRMAVNVSPIQLFDVEFLTHVKNALDRHQVPASTLELEITEGVFIDNPELAASIFKEIRDLGITVAIDDFGTGYSSLAYITHLPIDHLKLDRSFILQIDKGDQFKGVLTNIIDIAKHLNLIVTAEGIETREHMNLLKAFGCDQIQGYLYSKPLNAKAATTKLTSPDIESLFKGSQ
jgi:diguanylate cyclase (GGDEF)-like protein